MRCPACKSGNVSPSPQTGMLCMTCECNFDPKHGLPGAQARPELGRLGSLADRGNASDQSPERRW